jgi:hypothetical protein
MDSPVKIFIGVAIALLFASVVMGISGTAGSSSTLSFGVNGLTEMRCINGFMFMVGQDGGARQVLDEFGKGARCK